MPFFSYGGSSMVVNLIIVGLLMRIIESPTFLPINVVIINGLPKDFVAIDFNTLFALQRRMIPLANRLLEHRGWFIHINRWLL